MRSKLRLIQGCLPDVYATSLLPIDVSLTLLRCHVPAGLDVVLPFLQSETTVTVETFCLLTRVIKPFQTGVYSKRKEFAFIPVRAGPL